MFKRYFSVIDRYISRELLFTWLAVSLILMLILLSSTLAHLLKEASEGSIPQDSILVFLGIISIRYLILVLPLSLYLGVLLTFSRLYKDNEMAVLSACGVGLARLYRPLLIIVIPVSLLMLGMTIYVVPSLSHQYKSLEAEIENSSELTGLVAGRFNESNDGNTIMFLEKQSEDRRSMENIFLHQKTNQQVNIETAAKAHRYKDDSGRSFFLFTDGRQYHGQPGRQDFRIIEYEKHGVYIKEKDLGRKVTDLGALPTSQIWNSNNLAHKAELHWRIAIPIATFLLAMLAVPLSYTQPRKGRYSRLAPAILIYLVFSNLMSVGQTWMENGTTPVWLGLWWVHSGLLMLVLFWLFLRAGGFYRFFRFSRAHTV